ncbi:hypothetical protein C2S51_002633 [Perilla frutescens var. frutescens]|nr:hypothetical protein C2S51_002633 [Perilla frutescens var. frutescens]
MEKQPGDAGDFPGEKRPESAMISDHDNAAEDLFYQKLAKFNESSGLSLVFNFRQTMLDLHSFYKEVMKRGGFYQVTKMGKWDDVASVSNSKSCVSMSAAQLQNVYDMLILEYELMYCRKMPDQANTWPAKNSPGCFGSGVSPSCLKGKRKQCDSSSAFSTFVPGNRDGWTDKKDYCADTRKEAKELEMGNKNSTMIISANSNSKEFVVDNTDAPEKPRTGYHIFLRLETQRLKMTLGTSSSGQNLRELAVAAWRRLPEKDKLPYIEASKMDKERYERQMASYKKLHEIHKGKSHALFSTTTPSMLNFSTSMQSDDAYHVSLEDDSENVHSPDESMVKSAIEAMKSAKTNDSIFQIDWDNGSPSVPD